MVPYALGSERPAAFCYLLCPGALWDLPSALGVPKQPFTLARTGNHICMLTIHSHMSRQPCTLAHTAQHLHIHRLLTPAVQVHTLSPTCLNMPFTHVHMSKKPCTLTHTAQHACIHSHMSRQLCIHRLLTHTYTVVHARTCSPACLHTPFTHLHASREPCMLAHTAYGWSGDTLPAPCPARPSPGGGLVLPPLKSPASPVPLAGCRWGWHPLGPAKPPGPAKYREQGAAWSGSQSSWAGLSPV